MKPKIKKSKVKKTRMESCKIPCNSRCSEAVYGLGLIGSLVYFISTATGFWNGVLGVLKSFVWPAILVYEALKVLLV